MRTNYPFLVRLGQQLDLERQFTVGAFVEGLAGNGPKTLLHV